MLNPKVTRVVTFEVGCIPTNKYEIVDQKPECRQQSIQLGPISICLPDVPMEGRAGCTLLKG